mmetsp:Transcript_71216/g.206521  ORF Transcript_71216/g.206521 Transcript_71216/m.206521 type:complete len:351 (+) Transcript_71216:140-1192(+)
MRTPASSRATDASSSSQYSRLTPSSPTACSSQRAFNPCRSRSKTSRSASSAMGSLWPSGKSSPDTNARSRRQTSFRNLSASSPQVVCCTDAQAPRKLMRRPPFKEATNCRTSATYAMQLNGCPPTHFGLARHASIKLACMASKPVRKSPRRLSYCKSSSACKSASSAAGWTRVWHERWRKKRNKLCRTSCALRSRSASCPTVGTDPSACSRYSSGEIGCPEALNNSKAKSRNNHSKDGRLPSVLASSTCSANRHVNARVLNKLSDKAPLVFSTSTDDSSAQSVIICASRARSPSGLPKPSQSMKATSGPSFRRLASSASSSAREPHNQTPCVHAFVECPTCASGWPFCMR